MMVSSDYCTDLEDPRLAGYPPSERRAILVHRYYLGIELDRSPEMEETLASWETRIANTWRRDKMRGDAQAQVVEIAHYREQLSEQAGSDIDWTEAATEWAQRHAAAWRERWEETSESGA